MLYRLRISLTKPLILCIKFTLIPSDYELRIKKNGDKISTCIFRTAEIFFNFHTREIQHRTDWSYYFIKASQISNISNINSMAEMNCKLKTIHKNDFIIVYFTTRFAVLQAIRNILPLLTKCQNYNFLFNEETKHKYKKFMLFIKNYHEEDEFQKYSIKLLNNDVQ